MTSRPRAVVCGTGRNDVLVGNGQNDVLIGGAGNDTLRCGRNKNCTLIGGGGNDQLIGQGGPVTASFADHTTSLVASLATHLETDGAIHQTDHLAGVTNLTGGHGTDVLVGGPGNNKLVAGPGNQTLVGGTGNDTLIGGPGHDLLIGGRGHDHIYAGSGNDVIDGSDGGDTIDCGTGTSTVSTGPGDSESGDCHGDHHESLQRYHGTVTGIDTVANTITVLWSEVNSNAQAWLDAQTPKDPTTVTISLVGARIEAGGGGRGDGGGGGGDSASVHADGSASGGTIQLNDQVEVEATTDAGGNLVAVNVHAESNQQDLQEYHGTVTTVDNASAPTTMTVTYDEVNDTAQAWLDAQNPKDPTTVTISLVGANIERDAGLPIQQGDRVEVEAMTDTGGNLVAVNVHAEAPESDS